MTRMSIRPQLLCVLLIALLGLAFGASPLFADANSHHGQSWGGDHDDDDDGDDDDEDDDD
jgi:hypothetical protein